LLSLASSVDLLLANSSAPADVFQELRIQAERKRAGFKRKLAALQQEAGQLLARTEAKVACMRGGGGMPPAMAAMLQALGA
jgi:hypothetical protein